jgi:hypothetical protein
MLHLSPNHFTYASTHASWLCAILNQGVLPPYLPPTSIKSIRYSTLTADPALLMSKYSNQSMEALEGQHACTNYDVQLLL